MEPTRERKRESKRLLHFVTTSFVILALFFQNFFFLVKSVCATYTSSSLVLFLNLDENSGVTASDTSGNGLNGTVSGSPTWTSGNITLDGVDDKITHPNLRSMVYYAR